MDHYDVLIVGAGHAGAALAAALRQQGFDGSICLIGAEPDYPYERPPLSKEYLAGEKTFDRLLIRPDTFWVDKSIDVIRGERIVAINPVGRQVSSEVGQSYGYGELVWAAGGEPRRLSLEGADVDGVLTMRTRADADRLAASLPAAQDIVVIGGGYIGLESAAVLSKFGKRVTLLEMQDRVLARVAGESLSRFFEDEHRSHGVNVRTGSSIKSIQSVDGHVSGVEMADGEVLPADLMIVGVGIIPSVQPLADAGADCPNGVRVDGQCRTSLPHIWAIGDCALHASAYAQNAEVRLESVQNANDMAKVVAAALCGKDVQYNALPWFWSDQRDLKLQTLGLSIGYDAVVVRGQPESRTFSVIYLRDGAICAIDAVNAVKDYVQAKKLIIDGVSIDASELAKSHIELKAFWPK